MTRSNVIPLNRKRLCREYDRQLNAKIDLIEQLREHDDYDQLGKRLVLLPSFRRSDALILIAGALCAALVGTVIGIVENGWLL